MLCKRADAILFFGNPLLFLKMYAIIF